MLTTTPVCPAPESLPESPANAPKIAVLLNGIGDHYQKAICEGIAAQAEALCYSVLFFATVTNYVPSESTQEEYRLFKLPDLSRFDGIIFAANTIPSDDIVQSIRDALPTDRSIPVVTFGDAMDTFFRIDAAGNDCMRDVVRHFVRDHGFRRVNFISGPLNNADAIQRLQAYRYALAEASIGYDERRVYIGDFGRECGRQAVLHFLQGGEPLPQAIVCSNDNMALAAYAELTRQGLRVPEDVALSGYDAIQEAERQEPRITTVRQPLREMGIQAVQTIHNARCGVPQQRSYLFDSQVIIAESCGCTGNAVPDRKELITELILRNDELRINNNISMSMMELLTGSYTLQDVADELHALIQVLGFRQLYLCLDEESLTRATQEPRDYPEKMTMLLGYNNGETQRGVKFATRDVLPSLQSGRFTLVFAPLYYKKITFGYLAFDFNRSSAFMQRIWLKNVRLALENLRVQYTLKRYSATLEQMNLQDPLTGVYNRRGLERFAQGVLDASREGRGFAFVIFVDLDGLKRINDTYGHAAGDEAIRAVATILRQCSRTGDVVARMGGDEFVTTGLVQDEECLRSLLFSLQSCVTLFNEHSPHPFNVNASFGWCIQRPGEELSLMEMISRADEHLYEQKRIRGQR